MLAVLLADLLTAARTVVAGSDEGVPDRWYVSHGPPAFDCECGQLTVHTPGVRMEQREGAGCALQMVYPLVVTLVREVPAVTGDGLPSKAALDESGRALAADGDVLVGGLLAAWAAGSLFTATGVGCGQVLWRPGLAPVNPEGGVGGWTLGLEVRP